VLLALQYADVEATSTWADDDQSEGSSDR